MSCVNDGAISAASCDDGVSEVSDVWVSMLVN